MLVHGARVDLRGDIQAIHEDAVEPAGGVGGKVHVISGGRQGRPIVVGHAAVQRKPRQSAIQQAGIAEPIAETEGRGGTDAALPARSGSVERDDEATASGRLGQIHAGEDTRAGRQAFVRFVVGFGRSVRT